MVKKITKMRAMKAGGRWIAENSQEEFLSIFKNDICISSEADAFVPELGDGDPIDQHRDDSLKVAVSPERPRGNTKIEKTDNGPFETENGAVVTENGAVTEPDLTAADDGSLQLENDKELCPSPVGPSSTHIVSTG